MAASCCSNPACKAEETDFELRSICGEDATNDVWRCSLCQEEIGLDDWHSRTMPLYDIRQRRVPSRVSSVDSDTGYDLPLQMTDLNIDDRKKSSLLLTENYQRLDSQPSVEFDLEHISDMIDFAPCQNCGSPTTKVKGVDEECSLVWFCKRCDHYFGLDDSFSTQEAIELTEILAYALENNALHCDPCFTCANDDPDKFVFSEDSQGRLLLQCQLCYRERILSHAEYGDIDDGMNEAPISCDRCGNAEKDLFKIDVHGDGDLQKIECLVCRTVLDLSWTKLANHSHNPSDGDYQVTCDCRNTDKDAFEVHTNENGDPHTLVCLRCDKKLVVRPPELGTFSPAKGRTSVTKLRMLKRGDHISWESMFGYFHHAIVVATDIARSTIDCINYTGPDGKIPRGVIREDKGLKVDCAKDALYREDYDECHPVDVVINRARSKLGEVKYNPFTNNCEHFAQWCKTGLLNSDQIHKLKDFLVSTVAAKIVPFLTKDGVKQGINLVKFCTSGFGKSAVGAVAATGVAGEAAAVATSSLGVLKESAKVAGRSLGMVDMISIGLVIGGEGFCTGKDIYDLYQQKKKGHISGKEFIRCTIKRCIEGVGTVGGSAIGSILGQICIPIPIIGGLIGNALGTVLGKYASKVLGRLVVKFTDGK